MTVNIGLRDPNTGYVYTARYTGQVTGASGPSSPGSATLVTAKSAAGGGLDHSVGVTGATGTLLATVQSNPTRAALAIQNLSGAEIWVHRQETVTGASGPTGIAGTLSVFALAAGATGAPPAPYVTETFKGQVTVYGATGAAVAIFED